MFSEKLIAPALGPLLLRPGRLRVAWDVVRHTACPDCSLGTSGLHDGVLPGLHLCGRRLRRVAEDLTDPIPPGRLADVRDLQGLSAEGLRGLGRLGEPLLRRSGAPGFTPISWEDAANLARARLRDAREGARSTVFINPAGLHIETLFQLRRFAGVIERRDRAAGIPASVELLVSARERALRRKARPSFAAGGRTLWDLEPGDPVAVVAAHEEQPLLPEVLAALQARGVLAERVAPDSTWPTAVRATFVFGEPGVLAAQLVGLPLRDEAPTEEAIAELDTAYVVGACPPGELTRGLLRVPARLHQTTHLDATLLAEPGEFVLLLPANAPHEHPGGGTLLCDDGRLRFGPEVLGHDVPGARPHWAIPVLILGLVDPDAATELAVLDAAELRTILAESHPALHEITTLHRAGDTARLLGPRDERAATDGAGT